jgi:exopolysaccharide biosynthesis polyprenyl glycosylphosphotransferase
VPPPTPISAIDAAEPLAGLEAAAPRRRTPATAVWQRWAAAVDAAMLVAAALAAQLGAHAAGLAVTPTHWLVAFSALVLAISYARGGYAWRIRLQAIDDLWSVVTCTAIAGMIVLSLRALLGDDNGVASQTLRVWAFATVYVGAGRVARDWTQAKARRAGELTKRALIVGAGDVGRLTAKRLLDHPEFGLHPIGFLDKEPREGPLPLPVLGASWDLEDVVEQHRVEHVIVTFSTAPSEVLLRLARRCDERGIGLSLVPRLYERMNERLTVEHIGGLPLICARRRDPAGWQFGVKYALDRVVAAITLVTVLPVMAAAGVAVGISLGRPIFFRQRRVGRDGKSFDMLKFRSMDGASEGDVAVADLPPDTAPGGVEGGDRRTRVGAFLRATSIDELPQLINVLKGDMSLVGPRPERPEFVDRFTQSVRRYGDRHRVKAGITGWAQVHGLRGKTSISDRAEWDNYYIENWSLWLDLKILLMTVAAVAAGSHEVE